jgi:hypothetical protein
VLKGIELGAGPASGACGIAAGETHGRVGIPTQGNWALIEQDRGMLELGAKWAQTYFADQGRPEWSTRPFHREVDFAKPLLPRAAPKFNLWVMSYVLNEVEQPVESLARRLVDAWDAHLENESLIILVEPALKLQSRRLLELRRALIELKRRQGVDWLTLLLPCLGEQSCGALANPTDWCHEEVTWWRPPYFRVIDQMAGLDRKTLPFSYLVFAKSRRARAEILPAIAGPEGGRYRLVSPAHAEGRDLEFFLCGQEGKRRARLRPQNDAERVGRGDILLDAEVRGDAQASRVERTRVLGGAADEESEPADRS